MLRHGMSHGHSVAGAVIPSPIDLDGAHGRMLSDPEAPAGIPETI